MAGRRWPSLFLFFLGSGWWGCGLEALEKEGCVKHKANGYRDQSVHEEVQLGLPEAVLPQPIEHLLLRHNVT